MEVPPLSLSVVSLLPSALHQPTTTPPSEPLSLPALPTPAPALSPTFSLSPSPNHPPPYPSILLGQTVSIHLRLSNSNATPVAGVKTMLELQSPGARTRLTEVIHGQSARDEGTAPDEQETRAFDNLPRLEPGEGIDVLGEGEVKELGTWIGICSVAWETRDGRKTFQRFFKFNVTPPFSIKTRIHTPSQPNAALSPSRRKRVFLEVLVQNAASQALGFRSVDLEPVLGLEIVRDGDASASTAAAPSKLASLLPGDTTQFLFILQPTSATTDAPARSLFPPHAQPGSIAPLGRLDVSYVCGPHHERGRLQTSTLNRRVPAAPSRARSAPRPPLKDGWEVDLVVRDDARDVAVEAEFTLRLRLALRAPATYTPDQPTPALALQYLSPIPPAPALAAPLLSPPARSPSAAPPSPASQSRVLTPASATMSPGPSRASLAPLPVTPSQNPSASGPPTTGPAPAAPWPPVPELPRRTAPQGTGRVAPLGHSLVVIPALSLQPAIEATGPSYEPPPARTRYEAAADVDLRFLALDEGMCELGGVRVLDMDDRVLLGEWDSLGDVWVA
ncbi:hypothetical protein Q5752_003305 [Cryptotrichosporon argae]